MMKKMMGVAVFALFLAQHLFAMEGCADNAGGSVKEQQLKYIYIKNETGRPYAMRLRCGPDDDITVLVPQTVGHEQLSYNELVTCETFMWNDNEIIKISLENVCLPFRLRIFNYGLEGEEQPLIDMKPVDDKKDDIARFICAQTKDVNSQNGYKILDDIIALSRIKNLPVDCFLSTVTCKENEALSSGAVLIERLSMFKGNKNMMVFKKTESGGIGVCGMQYTPKDGSAVRESCVYKYAKIGSLK